MKILAYLFFIVLASLAMPSCSEDNSMDNPAIGGYKVVWQDTVVYSSAPFNDTITWKLEQPYDWRELGVVKDSFDWEAVPICLMDSNRTCKGVKDTVFYWIKIGMRKDSLFISGDANTNPDTRNLKINIWDVTSTWQINVFIRQKGQENLP